MTTQAKRVEVANTKDQVMKLIMKNNFKASQRTATEDQVIAKDGTVYYSPINRPSKFFERAEDKFFGRVEKRQSSFFETPEERIHRRGF